MLCSPFTCVLRVCGVREKGDAITWAQHDVHVCATRNSDRTAGRLAMAVWARRALNANRMHSSVESCWLLTGDARLEFLRNSAQAPENYA